jgi:hypothetical protein
MIKKLPLFNPLGTSVIKAFEAVDAKNKRYYGNVTQRKACDFLIAEYGLDNVLKRVEALPKLNGRKYFPTILTPHQLVEKWVTLELAVKRLRDEKKKGGLAFQ